MKEITITINNGMILRMLWPVSWLYFLGRWLVTADLDRWFRYYKDGIAGVSIGIGGIAGIIFLVSLSLGDSGVGFVSGPIAWVFIWIAIEGIRKS